MASALASREWLAHCGGCAPQPPRSLDNRHRFLGIVGCGPFIDPLVPTVASSQWERRRTLIFDPQHALRVRATNVLFQRREPSGQLLDADPPARSGWGDRRAIVAGT